jgi:hypothetical protein
MCAFFPAFFLVLSVLDKSIILVLSIVLFIHTMNSYFIPPSSSPAGIELPSHTKVDDFFHVARSFAGVVNRYNIEEEEEEEEVDEMMVDVTRDNRDDHHDNCISLDEIYRFSLHAKNAFMSLPSEFVMRQEQLVALLCRLGIDAATIPSALSRAPIVRLLNYRNRPTITVLPHLHRVNYQMLTAGSSLELLEYYQRNAEMLDLPSYPVRHERLAVAQWSSESSDGSSHSSSSSSSSSNKRPLEEDADTQTNSREKKMMKEFLLD